MTRHDLPQARIVGSGPVIGRPTSRWPMRLSFCSHLWQGASAAQPFPFFDPYYVSIADAGERRALRQFKRSIGVTGWCGARRYDYDPNEALSHLRERDLTWTDFRRFVDEWVDDGFFVHIYLAPDRGPETLTTGELRDACLAMRAYAPRLYALQEWEIARSGGAFTSAQIGQGVLLMRELLGDDAMIGVHGRPSDVADAWFTAASFLGTTDIGETLAGGVARRFFDREAQRERLYWTEADDPSHGEEIDWWYTEAGLEVDFWDWQSRHGHLGPADTLELSVNGQETWLARLVEGAERFLPDGTVNYYGAPVRTRPILDSDHPAPDWFARPRRRGRPVLVAFEDVPYEYSRGQVSEAHATAVTRAIARTGITSVGCLAAVS